MADLVIAVGKGKPPTASRKDAMGGDEAPASESEEPKAEDLDSFDASLDDAYDALERKDRSGFKDALGAAIAAKCAEMYGEHDDSDEKKEY